MPAARQSDASGYALSRKFRLAVVVMVLGVLWWFLLGVLERETRNAEARAANMVIGQLRSALVIKGAEVMLSRDGRLAEHRGINPFGLVEHQWGNYKGQCQAEQLAPATWCFRVKEQKETESGPKGWLIYKPGQPITIDSRRAIEGQPLVWEVTTEFADRNGNGMREQEERLTGLKLAPVSLTEEAAQTQDAQR
ncbi:hypothetical protein FMN52_05085 [Marinobacter sp. BW6]|uniref:hypothetical protein n=1 Tax=Marinobacter sp. BW6 TaxID=2592624 RepID=UPI0011DED938|nr:hypothetical protein [Marinobacter sp. BW6]TYC60361.1 hypothetical protein FMN52_05085 [Marinobacter sp. BW6]